MATRTYAVGTKSGARRLDDFNEPWVDISVVLAPLGAPISVILRDVMTDPLDSDKIFVVGDRIKSTGATGIYMSTDAGTTWYQPSGGGITDLDIDSIDFPRLHEVWVVDSNIAYTCGDGGVLYKTIDGGDAWDLTPVLPTVSGNFDPAVGNSYALHFITDQIGVVAFESFVFKTTDGGTSWTNLNSATPISLTTPITGIHISVDQQTIVALNPREILRSTDAGATWSVVETFLYGGEHLTWLNDNDLFAFGGGNDRKVSTDAGATWIGVSAASPSGPQQLAGHMYDANNGYYDSDSETMVTSDGLFNGIISETAPYFIQAIWTHVDSPAPEPCGCPEDTTYNPLTNECEGFATMDAVNAGTTYTVGAADKILNYGSSGTIFFENIDSKPYPIRRDGAFSSPNYLEIEDSADVLLNIQAVVSNDAWGDVQGPDTLNGRLNIAGIWTDLPYTPPADHNPTYTWLGFTACVETPVAKVYYIGVGADNQVRVRINGVLVIQLLTTSAKNFQHWHMFPVTLPAGTNFIELEGRNLGDFAAFAAEIYDADFATLTAITTPSQIDSVLVFSTKDRLGTAFDNGQGVGWECPPGWDLNFCDGYPQCSQYLTAPFEPCNCYLVTNCEDPTEQVLLTTEEPLDLSMTYVFYGYPNKCWTVETSLECPPNDTITDVAQAWATCEACVGVCYTLTDCEGIEAPIQVSNDLSQYLDPFGVGRIVNLTRCPEVCWQIIANPGHCTGAEEVVIITEDFDTCEECIGVEVEPELMLNHRKVEPGYGTAACSTDYVEKVECSFAEAMYQEVISKRYGIEFCCEIDALKYEIKHEDLKLRLITDPNACVAVPVDCCPPCNVTAIIIRECPEPQYVFGRIIR